MKPLECLPRTIHQAVELLVPSHAILLVVFPIAEKLPELFRINENASKQSSLKSPNLRRKFREPIGTDGAPDYFGKIGGYENGWEI